MCNYVLFETHAHYDHALFEGHGPKILRELLDDTIDGCVIPAISYESNFNRTMFPFEQFSNVFFAAGLHPKISINEPFWNRDRKRKFEEIVDDYRTVAVKTGLDFSKLKLTRAQKEHQVRFFKYLIDIANKKQLPLILHLRNSVYEAIKVLYDNPIRVEAVVHCFVYDYKAAEMLINAGVTRFGINSMIEREEMDELRAAVKKISMERLLVETDAPFIKPDGFAGNFNTSKSLIRTVEKISEIKQISIEDTVRELQNNAREFYGLS